MKEILGLAPGAKDFSAMSLLITTNGNFFLADTQVRVNPSADELADMALHCAEHVRRFGLQEL